MNSSTLDVPLLNTRGVPGTGQTSFFGGAVAKWTEDGISLAELSARLQSKTLTAHLLAAYLVLSNHLLMDCPWHVAARRRSRSIPPGIAAGRLRAEAITSRLYLLDRAEVERFVPPKRGPVPGATRKRRAKRK
jgi:hypothetical protein